MVAVLATPSRRSVALSFLILSSALVGLVMTAPNAAAVDQYVSGPISVSTTWVSTNTYYVTDHVTVLSGVTLTIEPATKVYFDVGRGLFVEGSLWADGGLGFEIQLLRNASLLPISWYGIQFNASSSGSVSYAFFDRPDRAVAAVDSSPAIHHNGVLGATWGFALLRSNTVLEYNVVDGAAVGVYVAESDAIIQGNQINGTTNFGIRAETSGSPSLTGNVITNARGSFAVGIYTTGVDAYIAGNSIQGALGRDGPDGVGAGAPGMDGGSAVGVIVDGGTFADVTGNWIDSFRGGRGGNGAANPSATGGRGGHGGSVSGIVVANVGSATLGGNVVTNLTAGRGGTGGAGSSTSTGGNGGDGGDASGFQVINVTSSAWIDSNYADSVIGGIGGHGGDGTLLDGFGASGGDSLGLFVLDAADAEISGNGLQAIDGGLGGNSTLTGLGNRAGGAGGAGTGIALFGPAAASTVHANGAVLVSGGDGGRGSPGGRGGDGTGMLIFGNNDRLFNATSMTFSTIAFIAGGNGGLGEGATRGGDGGTAAGIGAIRVTATIASNEVVGLFGGSGGDGVIGGRGGDASGVAGIILRGSSMLDSVSSVFRGSDGSPAPIEDALATAFYVGGNASFTTAFTIDNATFDTIGGVDDRDFFADDYANLTTINVDVQDGRVRVGTAGNLTVRNFLGVDAFWPDSVTFVPGAGIQVKDNVSPVWDLVSATGSEQWLLVTDRVYVNSNVATQNATEVTVTYAPETFQGSPRLVDMATTHVEAFVMVDSEAPSSQAGSLSTYMTALTFPVTYTASDGLGGGLANITLWYRKDGGAWTSYATQPGAASGTFSFTASGDGTHEFQTIAEDVAGNTEPGPGANDTWTIVDTTRPGSHVNGLPTYRTTRTFLVSWAPDPGTTDIDRYTIEYNRGSGWVTWLIGTTLTSAMFTAPSDGLYQFRSKAVDLAGNSEVLPSTNDTWTIVDTEAPFTGTIPLPRWHTVANFVVQWRSESDDLATYRIQVRDDGGPWTDWLTVSVTTTSGTFTGAVDGHTYEFRSIGTDWAGNVQTASPTNQSWTTVDMSPPDSAVTVLPPYVASLLFNVAWGPVSGTTDIVAYTLQSSDDGGPWTSVAGAIDTAATTASFVGADGHRYAFRTIARDAAGNVEVAPAGNDTWTIVDVTAPFVTETRPVGSNTNLTPSVVITFSEPMDRTAVRQAFTITPAIDGDFTWSADSRVLTFVPRTLEGGTTYFVVVGSNARDLAGNQITQQVTFQFSTSPGPSTFGLADYWWVLAVVGAAVGGALFLIARRRSASGSSATRLPPPPPPKGSEAIVEDVFLLNHRDGVLIKHETRRLRPDVDSDILSGMLTAVQQFVKDALRGDDYAELNEMTVGHMHILIGRGKYLVLAARIEGDGSESWTAQIERCIKDMEDHHWDQLEDWDGDMALARVLTPYVKKLVQGGYALLTAGV